MKNVGIVNYKMGNLRSIKNSLNYFEIQNELVNTEKQLQNKTHLILPGVGSFKQAMKNLKELKLIESIKNFAKEKKILGICLGMQLLGTSSTEQSFTNGLNLVNMEFDRFDNSELKNLKIPHVGFNSASIVRDDGGFFKNIKQNSDFYFVHSFKTKNTENLESYSFCNYGENFLAAFKKGNIYGTQFHPEKSQSNGALILRNFLK